MASERWDFVRQFRRNIAVTYWRVKVNGLHYCDIGFPEEEEYVSVVDTCICMVEGDQEYTGQRVINTYLNIEDDEISFHMGPMRPRVGL